MDIRRLPRAPLVAIAAADLLPLVGVLALGWDLGLVTLLFWSENVVVGLFGIARMAILAGWGAVVLVPFFLVHFGMFSGVHLSFLLLMFVEGSVGAFLREHATALLAGWAALMLSHGVSFVQNFLRRERTMAPGQAMVGVYKRVVVLHLTIIFGAWAVIGLGSPVWALALLVVLKFAADVVSHAVEHTTRAASAGPVAVPS